MEKKPMTMRLRDDLVSRLDEQKRLTGAPKTFIIEKALDEYFERQDARSGQKIEQEGHGT